uniref:Uncharacterized protein n=1 Tax=Oryza rufipogon TaxID=4529 RepID=A0A0E0R723_ORYRU
MPFGTKPQSSLSTRPVRRTELGESYRDAVRNVVDIFGRRHWEKGRRRCPQIRLQAAAQADQRHAAAFSEKRRLESRRRETPVLLISTG